MFDAFSATLTLQAALVVGAIVGSSVGGTRDAPPQPRDQAIRGVTLLEISNASDARNVTLPDRRRTRSGKPYYSPVANIGEIAVAVGRVSAAQPDDAAVDMRVGSLRRIGAPRARPSDGAGRFAATVGARRSSGACGTRPRNRGFRQSSATSSNALRSSICALGDAHARSDGRRPDPALESLQCAKKTVVKRHRDTASATGFLRHDSRALADYRR